MSANSKNLIALAITLALTSTPEEVQEAHDAIDAFFDNDGSITPQEILNENVQHNATAANGLVVDKDGLPWDERIHSSNKKMTGKGVWTARKNVDDSVRNKVVAELRAALAAGGATAAPVTLTNTGPALGATGPSLGTTGATVTTLALPSEFEKLVADITKHTFSQANPAGILTDAFVKSVLDWKQVPDGNIQNLAHMGDVVIGEIRAYLTEQLATKGVTF